MANDKRLLEEHGTELMVLKPSSIWSAAQNDLAIREKNQEDSGVRHYAFHRDHVRNASSPNDVIRAALKDPEKGIASAKFNTRLIYSDVERLKAALK